MKVMTTAYDDDLAYIHDVGFTRFVRNAAPGVLQTLADRGISDGTVVDLGCGSGVWAKELCDAGYDVVGVDISAAMIKLAKRRSPRATLHVASFLEFELPACGAVTALGEVLNYRFDSRNNIGTLRKLFKRVYSALEPNGLLIFDLAGPGRNADTAQRFAVGDDWAVLVDFDTAQSDRLKRRIVTFRKKGRAYRRCEESHELQLYEPNVIAKLLREIGFRVRTSRKFGDAALYPHATAFIARKPEN